MHKVYLLLRNNKQTGPYTLEELIGTGLTPTDLIWVEGKSCGWSNPEEIEALAPYMPRVNRSADVTKSIHSSSRTNDTSVKKESLNKQSTGYLPSTSSSVFISMPTGTRGSSSPEAESPAPHPPIQKATYLPANSQPVTTPSKGRDTGSTNTAYARSLSSLEEDFTNWLYHKKIVKNRDGKKKKVMMVVVAAIGITVALYFGATTFFSPDTKEREPRQAPVAITPPLEEHPSAKDELGEPSVTTEVPQAPKEVARKVATITTIVRNNKRVQEVPVQPSTQTTSLPNSDEEYRAPSSRNSEPQEEEPVTTEPKKKTFGEKLDGLFDKFKKKKKEEPEVIETTSETAPLPRSSQRKSVRRGDSTPVGEEPATPLATGIDITADNPDNWMMGIKGLTLTLRNRSNEWIRNAEVEISYYTERNTLLEKKRISFANIPSGKTQTVAAPDHKLADHTEHHLITISTKDGATVHY